MLTNLRRTLFQVVEQLCHGLPVRPGHRSLSQESAQLRGAIRGEGGKIHNEVEGVPQLVGDAGRQGAQRCHFLLNDELLLGGLELSEGALQFLGAAAFGVAQPFLLQAGVDASPQQHRVERLVEVVLGPTFDAAHDAVDLIQARHHDDRDFAQPLIGLDLFQGGVAIHLGHEHIEQEEVERLTAQ